MSKFFLIIITSFCSMMATAQVPKTELYDLIKKLLYDSTGFENIGDWAVGKPKKYPVSWQSDKIEMSNDTSINFYRKGMSDITIKGKQVMSTGKAGKWNIMLKGPRMGYGSFSIMSPASPDLQPKVSIDSIFAGKPYGAKLLKRCDTKPLLGYYYYEVKLPKKDVAFVKISWLTVNGSTAYRIDGYDSWSKYAVKFDCK